jgi:hypothetical protein
MAALAAAAAINRASLNHIRVATNGLVLTPVTVLRSRSDRIKRDKDES